MKKLIHISLMAFLAIAVVACGEGKENPILGKWVSANDSLDTSYLMFSKKDTNQDFSQLGWYPEEIKGQWVFEEGKVTLTYIKPTTYSVDSVMVTNQTDGASHAVYYQDDIAVAETVEGQVKPIETIEEISITSLIENDLIFSRNGERFDLIREEKEAKALSFVSVIRGIVGMMFLLGLTFVFSVDKKNIDWGLVIKGTALQIIIAILVLKVPFIESAFNGMSWVFVKVISFTDSGVDFLFGQMGTGVVQGPLITFAVKVLPTIIFFSALMSMFYYLGVVQKVVYVFAWVMKRFMRMSGAESLAAAGNVFLGQTESPLLVKPYLLGMTKSELMCLMTGGMATIAGGVLAAYVFFLGGDDPVEQAFFAKHLLTASIISAPAAVVAAKILVPETEEISKDIEVTKEKIGTNLLEAIANGTTDGLKLAVNVGAMLLVFIALMAMGNWVLELIGEATTLNETIAANTPYKEGLSFQFVLGYVGAPIVWLLGVDAADMVLVGELLGQKTILNEFIAYPRLGELKAEGALSEKSVIIATYMLCGFANFASIGIQIGGIGSLVPSRKGLLSQLGMRALLGGTIASLMTAAIVGMMY